MALLSYSSGWLRPSALVALLREVLSSTGGPSEPLACAVFGPQSAGVLDGSLTSTRFSITRQVQGIPVKVVWGIVVCNALASLRIRAAVTRSIHCLPKRRYSFHVLATVRVVGLAA